MTESIQCEFAGCPRESPKEALSEVVKLYELHTKAKHPSSQVASKTEKAKRPELAAEMSDEDWLYFKS